MEKQPKEKSKAIILQSLCYANDDIFVLATCGGKYHLIHFKDDKVIDVYPTASGMWLTTAFLDKEGKPNIALAAQKGNTQIITPGIKPKKITIDTTGTGPGKLGYLNNAFTYKNEAYLSGSNHQLYVYREGCWQDLRPKLLKAIEENSYEEIRFRSTHDITLRNDKILLLVNENIFEGDGNAWTKFFGNSNFNNSRYKSIVYVPAEDSIYLSANYKSLTKIKGIEQGNKIIIDGENNDYGGANGFGGFNRHGELILFLVTGKEEKNGIYPSRYIGTVTNKEIIYGENFKDFDESGYK